MYRGDADPEKKRNLKEVYPGSLYSGLLTNMSDSGNGLEIFSESIIGLINRHVEIGSNKSHFLSFSESRDRAIFFATSNSKSGFKKVKLDENWDAGLITLDTTKFVRCREIETGVFKCQYQSRTHTVNPCLSTEATNREIIEAAVSSLIAATKLIDILLIDVVNLLRTRKNTNLAQAIANAERDSEWIVLPLEPAQDIPGEFTARLDDGCISSFERFKYNSD